MGQILHGCAATTEARHRPEHCAPELIIGLKYTYPPAKELILATPVLMTSLILTWVNFSTNWENTRTNVPRAVSITRPLSLKWSNFLRFALMLILAYLRWGGRLKIGAYGLSVHNTRNFHFCRCHV